MVFTKPRLDGPSGIIIQQDRRFGNTFGNGFEIAVQLDITDCTFLSWVLYLIFILALYEIHGSCLQTSPMQQPDHLKCDLMLCCQRFFSNVAPVVAAGTKIYEAVVVNEYRSTKQGNKFYVHEVCGSYGSLLVLDDAGRIKQKQESADTVLKTEEGGERPSFPANKIITQNDAPVKKDIRSEKARTLQRKAPYPHRLDGIGLSGRAQKSSLK